jgi:hypothetical protein
MSDKQSKKRNLSRHDRTGKGQFHPEKINLVGVPISVPSSTLVLPNPLWLCQKDTDKVRSFERPIYCENRVEPGQYSSFAKIKRILFPIHDRLIDEIENKIKELDGTSLAIRLYDQLEIMYGTLAKHRLEAMALTAATANKEIPLAIEREWRWRSMQLLGVRYLIEMTVKISSNAHKSITDKVLSELMALGMRVVEMDFFLDHVYHNVIPHELLITKDLTADLRLSKSGIRATLLWEDAKRERLFDRHLEHLANIQRTMDEPISVRQLTEDKTFRKLDGAMKCELGYGLEEWLHLSLALIKSFDVYERLKIEPKVDFIQYLRDSTGLDPNVIDLYLGDRILSQRHMSELTREDMLPSEKFWRDHRLTNRPIVEIEGGSVPLIIFGIETVQQGSHVYTQSLDEGRAQLPRAKPKGPIVRALGSINEKAGNVFRDEIMTQCRKMGLEATAEKASIKETVMPEGVGPVDVFVFDKPHMRFILVEAKDISVRITPKELKNQKEEFIGKDKNDTESILSKLHYQKQWFVSLLPSLKEDYGLAEDQEVIIEAVVVVSHPMMWVFSYQKTVPILDDYEFFKKLQAGEELVYKPS